MQCYRSLGGAGIGQPPLQFLYPELQGGDIAGRQRRGLATKDNHQVAARGYHIPSLLSASKLVVGCGALLLTAGPFASSARWQLVVTLARASVRIHASLSDSWVSHFDFGRTT